MKWCVVLMLVTTGCAAKKPPSSSTVEASSVDTYRMARAEFDALTIPKLARLANAAPHSTEAGQTDGFVLWNLQPLPLRMGLKENDVVHEVGGHSLRNLPGALAAWNALQRRSEIDVVLSRRGRLHRLLWLIE